MEATTGWRFVVEELRRAGIEPHLAEPAETNSLRGRKKRAKTDRLDAGHLRDLLVIERLPESWIPPEHIQEIRTLMRMRHTMTEERSAHQQRIHAQLFHNGYPQQRNVLAADQRERLQKMELPMTCSPETDPVTMRVRRPDMGTRRVLDEEETHPGADRPHAARSGRRAGHRSLGSRDRKEAWHKRGDLPSLEEPLRRMKADATKRLKELEKENARLKKIVAEQAVDISILKEVSRINI